MRLAALSTGIDCCAEKEEQQGGGEQQEEIQQLINNTKPLTKKVCAGGVAISKGKGNIYYGHGLTVHTPSSATHTHTEIH